MIVSTQSSPRNAGYFCHCRSARYAPARPKSMLGLQTTVASSLVVPQIEPRETPLVCKTFTHHHNLSPRPPMAAARPLLKSP
jgi:hypothetical protein